MLHTVSKLFPYVSADGLRELLQKLEAFERAKKCRLPDNMPDEFRSDLEAAAAAS